jgi:hypothetical protein
MLRLSSTPPSSSIKATPLKAMATLARAPLPAPARVSTPSVARIPIVTKASRSSKPAHRDAKRRTSRAVRAAPTSNDDGGGEDSSTAASASSSSTSSSSAVQQLVGEDAALFDLAAQSLPRWLFFGAELTVVMIILWFAWLSPDTGLARGWVRAFEGAAGGNSTAAMVLQLSAFAAVHSGLAFLRPWGEAAIGPRAWRVLFAGVSLPLAASSVAYFINHRYDGVALWDVRGGSPALHPLLWAANYVSFFLLYPSTFNLLEVAAVDEPRLHLWETGSRGTHRRGASSCGAQRTRCGSARRSWWPPRPCSARTTSWPCRTGTTACGGSTARRSTPWRRGRAWCPLRRSSTGGSSSQRTTGGSGLEPRTSRSPS